MDYMKERTDLAQFIRTGCDQLFLLQPQLLAGYDGSKEIFAAVTETDHMYNGEAILLVTAQKYGRKISCYSTNGKQPCPILIEAEPLSASMNPIPELKLAVILDYHWMWMKSESQPCLFEIQEIPQDPRVARASSSSSGDAACRQ